MTDHKSTEDNGGKSPDRKRRPRWILMTIAGALVLVVGGMTWSAVAHSGKSWDGERFERFVEWKIDDMLDEVDASDDQRERVRAIATAAIADMGEFRDFKREGRQALVEALTQETVDREALETLRQNKLETADRASQRLLTALADAADVLTPVQRAELAEEWESRDWHHKRD
ncbi:MAG: periplasmic heavy metal sensor [Rhodospirillales bacterium]|nr:periplasmic heavy metal sensor [Rhodospirillales bacterium]MDE0378853.1 periplasmic heavy metal sensor [Rhodospirillales bacterium]